MPKNSERPHKVWRGSDRAKKGPTVEGPTVPDRSDRSDEAQPRRKSPATPVRPCKKGLVKSVRHAEKVQPSHKGRARIVCRTKKILTKMGAATRPTPV